MVASESELAIQESRFVPTVNPPAARPSTRCVNAVLQAIALTVTSTRITVASIRGTQWAEWSSLTAFVLGTRPAGRRPEMACARGGIIGPRGSANLLGK